MTLYVCGVTPYDTTHLGHAFTFVQFDALVRVLRWSGRQVTSVTNVTDIDDSILQRARSLGENWQSLGNQQIEQYRRDMRALNVADPTFFVRATSVISTIRDMTSRLLEEGAAYGVEDGNIFFRVNSAPRYGELSKLDADGMLAIAAQQDDADVDDPRKENPLDFALWKGWSGGSDEPYWESPWGRGRPGWHIECSAINYRYLGPQVTIHGGGADLVFPHHESEIVQSEAVTGLRPFVDIWLHTAMTYMDGEKMSKSLGNMVFVRDLLRRYSADAIRLYLLSHHYRENFEWSLPALEAASTLATQLIEAAGRVDRGTHREEFAMALMDDLNTPRAIEVLRGTRGQELRELAAVLGLRLDGTDSS